MKPVKPVMPAKINIVHDVSHRLIKSTAFHSWDYDVILVNLFRRKLMRFYAQKGSNRCILISFTM